MQLMGDGILEDTEDNNFDIQHLDLPVDILTTDARKSENLPSKSLELVC